MRSEKLTFFTRQTGSCSPPLASLFNQRAWGVSCCFLIGPVACDRGNCRLAMLLWFGVLVASGWETPFLLTSWLSTRRFQCSSATKLNNPANCLRKPSNILMSAWLSKIAVDSSFDICLIRQALFEGSFGVETARVAVWNRPSNPLRSIRYGSWIWNRLSHAVLTI